MWQLPFDTPAPLAPPAPCFYDCKKKEERKYVKDPKKDEEDEEVCEWACSDHLSWHRASIKLSTQLPLGAPPSLVHLPRLSLSLSRAGELMAFMIPPPPQPKSEPRPTFGSFIFDKQVGAAFSLASFTVAPHQYPSAQDSLPICLSLSSHLFPSLSFPLFLSSMCLCVCVCVVIKIFHSIFYSCWRSFLLFLTEARI